VVELVVPTDVGVVLDDPLAVGRQAGEFEGDGAPVRGVAHLVVEHHQTVPVCPVVDEDVAHLIGLQLSGSVRGVGVGSGVAPWPPVVVEVLDGRVAVAVGADLVALSVLRDVEGPLAVTRRRRVHAHARWRDPRRDEQDREDEALRPSAERRHQQPPDSSVPPVRHDCRFVMFGEKVSTLTNCYRVSVTKQEGRVGTTGFLCGVVKTSYGLVGTPVGFWAHQQGDRWTVRTRIRYRSEHAL
jgi:hypothetical protein